MGFIWNTLLNGVYDLFIVRCRKSFEVSTQFSVLCRILTDQTQPMNNKVKLSWLEYFLELLPMLDSACLKESTGELLFTFSVLKYCNN